MNELVLLQCVNNSTVWAGFLDELPCTLICITAIIALSAVLKSVIPPLISNCHEQKMSKIKKTKEDVELEEQKRLDLQKQRLEFEQKLEYEKKLWDKLLKDTPSEDLEKKFDELKVQFDKLKVEYPKLRLDVNIDEKK